MSSKEKYCKIIFGVSLFRPLNFTIILSNKTKKHILLTLHRENVGLTKMECSYFQYCLNWINGVHSFITFNKIHYFSIRLCIYWTKQVHTNGCHSKCDIRFIVYHVNTSNFICLNHHGFSWQYSIPEMLSSEPADKE